MGLPSNYKRLQYIESTGAQYIDTGFKHNQNTRVVMDVVPGEHSNHAWLFEGRNSTSSGCKTVMWHNESREYMAYHNGTTGRYTFTSLSPNTRFLIDFNKNTCSVNGETYTWSSVTFQSNYNLVLLACNNAGTITGYANAKLYSCQIYDNGTLIRDYIPCISDSSIIGLYDQVNDTFYADAGGGTFRAGFEKHADLQSLFTDMAHAIRMKTGGTDKLVADDFPTNVAGITTLAEGSADATAAAADIASGKTAYVKGSKVTGTADVGYTHVEPTLFSASGTYTVPETGTYRICAIGAGTVGYTYNGMDSTYNSVGVCGGGGYLVKKLTKGTKYTVTIDSSKSSFGSLISATCGTRARGNADDGGTFSKSGTVSGTGVVAFSSNGKGKQKDIVPPSFWQSRLSLGGCDARTSVDPTNYKSGGAGLFGGNGGDARIYFTNALGSTNIEARTGHNGGGTGGGSTGSGGGGGYGGGAGRPSEGATSGSGGAGCVYIEKIG